MAMDLSELQEQLTMLEPHHRLWANDDFQRAAEVTKGQLENIESALMLNSWKSKVLVDTLTMMGLTTPSCQEDELRLYIALKAVLGFERRKLDLLETQSKNYEATKRCILELGRNGDIGIDRSVPAR